MKGSIGIGSAFGIPIRLHWSCLLLLLFSGSLQSPGLLLILFGSVLLHELGHGLMAKRFGIRVVDITFWPLGGMARLQAMPEVPRVEALVAVAGPVVNLILAALAATVAVLLKPWAGPTLGVLLIAAVFVNLLLGVSNLLPAFPMDGGRLLRAWFARSTDWVSATEKAVRIGRWVALSLSILAVSLMFFSRQSLCVVLVFTAFIWISGGWELMSVRVRHGQTPFGPGPGFDPSRYAQAEASQPAAEPEREATGSARRPRVWDMGKPGRGFDEDDIRAMENYRGRLRPPPEDGPNSRRNT